MSAFSKIDIKDNNLSAAVQDFLRQLLESEKIDALMVPWHLPMNHTVMPTLITDPEALDNADPLAPCFPVNAAKMASRLTRNPSGKKVGLVLRPCEIRAFVELVKLKQGTLEDTVIISTDCLGAYSNADYHARVESAQGDDPMETTRQFCKEILDGTDAGPGLASACRVCEHPVAENADINIGLFGVDTQSQILVEAATEKGEDILTALSLDSDSEPAARKEAVDALIADRTARRDQMFEETEEITQNFEQLSTYLSKCVNCYNCRVACPVCYCKECVFVTDVFDHDAFQYMSWADRKGTVKMPTDTLFFHLTRMAHISLTCVGCGQCSNACPNDIPLMELFRTVSHKAQASFDYEAGRSVDEPIPLSVFKDKEYEEEVGISSKSA